MQFIHSQMPAPIILFTYLFEVLNTRLKDLNILLSIDVDCNAIVAALAVCHLTKDTSIRACDTLNVIGRSVDIGFFGLIQLSVWIYILGSYLTV